MGSDALRKVQHSNPIIVSIHAPAWGATGVPASHSVQVPFQSTLPHGERRKAFYPGERNYRSFNPRSRMGSDSLGLLPSMSIYKFQSTLPHGERLILPKVLYVFIEFQSTLPHGERPQ